jgi:hypothetical protein
MTGSLREVDWDSSPAGPRQEWPASLKILASLIAASAQPMVIAWGDQRAFFYNDACIPILGARHPDAFGRPFFDVWPEAR